MSGKNDDENLDSMSKEDLQRWIQAVVDKTPQLVQRQGQLAHLEDWVKMKERDATCTRLLYGNAFEAVQDCESKMKSLYGMLGMEYRDEDSEEEGTESHIGLRIFREKIPCRKNDAVALALLEDPHNTLDPMMEKVSMAIQKSSKLVQDLVLMMGHSSSKSTSSLSDFNSRPSFTSESCYSEPATPTISDGKHIKPLDIKNIFHIVKTESLVRVAGSSEPSQTSHHQSASMPLIKTEPGLCDSQGFCDSKKGLFSDVKVKVEPESMAVRSPQASSPQSSSDKQQAVEPDPERSFDVKKSEVHTTEPGSTTAGSFNQAESEDTGTSSVGVDEIDFKVTAVTSVERDSAKSGSSVANSEKSDDTAIVGSKSSRKKGKAKKRKKEISDPPSDMKKRLRKSTNSLPTNRKFLVLSSSEDELDDFDPVSDPSYFISGAKDSEPSDSEPESPQSSPEAPLPQNPPANLVIAPPPQENPENPVKAPPSAPAQKPPVCDKPVPVQERKEVVLEVGTKVLAKSGPQMWSRGTVQHVTEEVSARSYTVEFQDQDVKVVPAHQVAEDKNPLRKDLFIGCRVVASYTDEKKKNCFNGGVMTELPDRKNRSRFLVFYDDNTVAYLGLPDFFIVCKQLDNIWTEIEDEALQKQVKDYLSTYPDFRIKSLDVGQKTMILRNGEIETCEVMECDCSLVRLCFKKDQMSEWVYKGNILNHANVFKLKQKSENLQKTQQPPPSQTKPLTLNQSQQPPQSQFQQPTQSQAKPVTQNQSQDAKRDKSQNDQPPSQSEKQENDQQKPQVPQKAQQTDQLNNQTNQQNAQSMRPASVSTGNVVTLSSV